LANTKKQQEVGVVVLITKDPVEFASLFTTLVEGNILYFCGEQIFSRWEPLPGFRSQVFSYTFLEVF